MRPGCRPRFFGTGGGGSKGSRRKSGAVPATV